MQHLLTFDECRSLGRKIGKVDDDRLSAYITEVELQQVQRTFGSELFKKMQQADKDARVAVLLDGGEYDGVVFAGLKTAIAYFVYALLIMDGDYQSTRYGVVVKQSDYSNRLSSTERSNAYNNTLAVANQYLSDCVKYCRAVGLMHNGKSTMTSYTIRKIG